MQHRLDAILSDLTRERRKLYRLEQESRLEPELSPISKDQLKNVQKDNSQNEKALKDLARDAANSSPDLEPIADQAQQVADQEMRKANEAMQSAGTRRSSRPSAARAETSRRPARPGHEEARGPQEDQRADWPPSASAQARLDQIAERQQRLADKAAELAAKDPMTDPMAKEQLEQVKREQDDLAADLEKLRNENDNLGPTPEETAKKLAEKARQLAQEQRQLAQEQRDTNQQRQGKLADLAKQEQLAEKARQLAEETYQPARAARTDPLKPSEGRRPRPSRTTIPARP